MHILQKQILESVRANYLNAKNLLRHKSCLRLDNQGQYQISELRHWWAQLINFSASALKPLRFRSISQQLITSSAGGVLIADAKLEGSDVSLQHSPTLDVNHQPPSVGNYLLSIIDSRVITKFNDNFLIKSRIFNNY